MVFWHSPNESANNYSLGCSDSKISPNIRPFSHFFWIFYAKGAFRRRKIQKKGPSASVFGFFSPPVRRIQNIPFYCLDFRLLFGFFTYES